MEDDEYQLQTRKPEFWEIPVDAHLVAEANARLREIPRQTRKKLWRQLDAAFASFAKHIEFSRRPLRVAGTTTNQWLPSGSDTPHSGRAYTDMDILSSREFRNYPAYLEMSRDLHSKASRALSLAISLTVIRDARWSDGFSILIARDLLTNFRPTEARALAHGERAIRKRSEAGRPGGLKRSKGFQKQREKVRSAYLRQSRSETPSEKMRALKALFPTEPSVTSLYEWTSDLRAGDTKQLRTRRLATE